MMVSGSSHIFHWTLLSWCEKMRAARWLGTLLWHRHRVSSAIIHRTAQSQREETDPASRWVVDQIILWLISPQPIPFLWKDLNNGLRIYSQVFNFNFLLKPHSVQLSLLALDFASASRSPDFILSILWGSSGQGWDCIGSASIAPLYHGRHRSLHLDQIWLILGVSVIQVSSGNLRKLCPYRLRVPYLKCFH